MRLIFRDTVICILFAAGLVLVSKLAFGQSPPVGIGLPCNPAPEMTQTARSQDVRQGVLECIPDASGNYHWQAMGAGIVLYDVSSACSTPGMLRWNGSAIQYCNGSSWQSLVGAGNGKLYWDANWTGDNYWCDSGYHIVLFHYDCPCSNNATWFECQAN
jgi:hypothetical protein